MGDELHLRIGALSDDHLIIAPTRREIPDASDYWDGNWLAATIRLEAGAFRGEYEAKLRANELASFRDAVKQLHQTLQGHAAFETMERWIAIRIEGDGLGHFTAECEARDDPGMGNRLTFAVTFDQTDMPAMLRSLDAICEAFPVVGHP